MTRIGLRREDLQGERRAPLAPEHVRALQPASLLVQSCATRVFEDHEYVAAGAQVVDGLPRCRAILGLKEIPVAALLEDQLYLFFSHTIKGQPQNMPLLRALLDRRCSLIDYERVVDERGRRLVLFGHFAGVAGMIDTLWTLGQRLARRGESSPLSAIKPALSYGTVENARRELVSIGQALPGTLPITVGVAGDGNVGRGAQLVLSWLGAAFLEPQLLLSTAGRSGLAAVVFREADTVEPTGDEAFALDAYHAHPERYRSCFARFLPQLDALANCIYWDARCPRLVSLDDLDRLWATGSPRLQAIGDISCDVNGGIEATVRCTTLDDPVYTYDLGQRRALSGFDHDERGPSVLAVYNLPSALPRDASCAFSAALLPLLGGLLATDVEGSLARCLAGLPPELGRALVVFRGELTPAYRYLERHL